MNQVRVLFTGGRSPATLALLRLFAQAGHDCQVAESIIPNLAGASRFCHQQHKVAPPRQQTKNFIADLKRILIEQKIDLLIPTCEETYYVSRYQRELESTGAKVFVSSIDVLTNLHSKYQFNQLLRALKIPAPASERISSAEQLMAIFADWQPCVLKPEFSRFASHVLIQPDREQAQALTPTEQDAWVLQEFLPGQQFCSYSVAVNGKLTAHSVYPTIYSAGTGATICFESVRVPVIEQIVAKLVEHLDYTGQISFDFIYSQDQYYPIECNPRTTTGTFLFAPADHLPQAFLEGVLAQTQSDVQPRKHPAGVPIYATADPVMLKLPMLIYALPQNRHRLSAFWKDFSQGQDPLMRLEDIGPFWGQFGLMWKTWLRARQQRVGLMEASTYDIEWNGSW